MNRKLRYLIGIITIAIALIIGAVFINSDNQINMDEIVDKASFFTFTGAGHSLPDPMVETLGAHKVVLLGEMHYVKEHEKLLGALLERLHAKGFRYLMNEESTASGLLIDYYIKGKLKELPDEIRLLHEDSVQALALFNSKLRAENKADEQISYAGFDLNHMRVEYSDAIKLLPEVYGIDPNLLKPYLDMPKQLIMDIEGGKLNELTEKQITELKYIAEAEIASAKILEDWDDFDREDFIEKYVVRQIDLLKSNEKLLVNCGAWHAQLVNTWKVTMKPGFKWVGMRLSERFKDDPQGLYSLMANAYKGDFKMNLYKPDQFHYELDMSKREHLMTSLMVAHPDQNCFLDYMGLPNQKSKVVIETPSKEVKLPLNQQYNGMLIYPVAHISEKLKYYENR